MPYLEKLENKHQAVEEIKLKLPGLFIGDNRWGLPALLEKDPGVGISTTGNNSKREFYYSFNLTNAKNGENLPKLDEVDLRFNQGNNSWTAALECVLDQRVMQHNNPLIFQWEGSGEEVMSSLFSIKWQSHSCDFKFDFPNRKIFLERPTRRENELTVSLAELEAFYSRDLKNFQSFMNVVIENIKLIPASDEQLLSMSFVNRPISKHLFNLVIPGLMKVNLA